MDIEDLSKSQLLLLTILVNFVVSIATGVMTVSLLDQAPATVTQTVNRIVDHTIETVTTQVPALGKDTNRSTEELLTSAIANNVAHTVTLKSKTSPETVIGSGLYLPASRFIMSVGGEIPDHVTVVFPGSGGTFDATRSGQKDTLVRFSFAPDAKLPQASTMKLIPAASLKQGQTVIGLTSDGRAVTGIISKIDADGVHAELPGVGAGTPLVNLSGELVGIGAGNGLFIGTERIDSVIGAPVVVAP